jgi:hypothetical protein
MVRQGQRQDEEWEQVGQLTADKCTKLQNYYQGPVVDNVPSVEKNEKPGLTLSPPAVKTQ